MRVELVRKGADGANAQLICLVAEPEEPLDRLPELKSSLAVIMVDDWGGDLTPWPAPAAYPDQQPYEGHARETLDELLHDTLPQIEREAGLTPTTWAIAGYSLAGLFSLWTFASSGVFAACASGSGSVWYPGWLDWLSEQRFVGNGRHAYLSLGSKESRVRHPLVAGVASATERTIELLEARGVECVFESNPGGHFTDISGRLAKALRALDGWKA